MISFPFVFLPCHLFVTSLLSRCDAVWSPLIFVLLSKVRLSVVHLQMDLPRPSSGPAQPEPSLGRPTVVCTNSGRQSTRAPRMPEMQPVSRELGVPRLSGVHQLLPFASLTKLADKGENRNLQSRVQSDSSISILYLSPQSTTAVATDAPFHLLPCFSHVDRIAAFSTTPCCSCRPVSAYRHFFSSLFSYFVFASSTSLSWTMAAIAVSHA